MKQFLFIIMCAMLCCTGADAQQRICNYCRGTGTMIYEAGDYVAHYGISNKKIWCQKCNAVKNSGHSHIYCNHCRGTGRTGSDMTNQTTTNRNNNSFNDTPSDDFMATYLTYAELETFRQWVKYLYTGFPRMVPCAWCSGTGACSWCRGTGQVGGNFNGRFVSVMCNNCYNGTCKHCAGTRTMTQYSKDPADMQMVQNKIGEFYNLARQRANNR